jgi:hypothetical protein
MTQNKKINITKSKSNENKQKKKSKNIKGAAPPSIKTNGNTIPDKFDEYIQYTKIPKPIQDYELNEAYELKKGLRDARLQEIAETNKSKGGKNKTKNVNKIYR